jgi:DNA-binding IscR family transcriptional regulator
VAFSTSFSKSLLLIIFVEDKVARGDFSFVPTIVISEQLDIPRASLSKIISALISKRIFEAKEGKNGGVRTTPEVKVITLYDVFVAVEEGKPLFSRVSSINAKGRRPDQVREGIQNMLDLAESTLHQFLRQHSLADFMQAITKE